MVEHEPIEGFTTPASTWPDSGYGSRPQSKWTPQRIKSKRVNVIELILQQVQLALTGFLGNGSGFSQLNIWGLGVTQKLTEHTDAIANLEDIAAATNTTPAYVSDLDDMATVPRSQVSTVTIVNSLTKPKFKDVLIADGTIGWLHHGVTPTIQPEVVPFVTQGHIYYTPIVVDRTGTVGDLRWIVGADTSIFSIDYYEMALCIYNPANGNVEKLWGSGNIKDAEADTTTIGEAIIDMALAQSAQPGQILFAAHQQVAPGLLQAPRRFAAVPQPALTRNVPLLDAWCYVAENHSQGIPSSISLASLTRENRFIPWAAVSVAAEVG